MQVVILFFIVVVIVMSLLLFAVLATNRRYAIKLTTTSNLIPKRIMMTWKTALTDAAPFEFKKNYRLVKRLHPDWDIDFFDDGGVEWFMVNKADKMWLDTYYKCHLRIQQIDIFRMAYIHTMGGFYLDCDVALTKPLDELRTNAAVFPQELAKNTESILQKRRCDYVLGNYAFGAVAHHPMFDVFVKHAHKMMKLLRIRSGEPNNMRRVIYTTGPVATTIAYLDYMDSKFAASKPVTILKGAGDSRFGTFGVHKLTGTWKNKSLISGLSNLR